MQMEWAKADMAKAEDKERDAAERRVLERQLRRERSSASGGGNVGGSPGPGSGRMYSLEDAILANSLGINSGIRRF
jgi:hypothetical protein